MTIRRTPYRYNDDCSDEEPKSARSAINISTQPSDVTRGIPHDLHTTLQPEEYDPPSPESEVLDIAISSCVAWLGTALFKSQFKANIETPTSAFSESSSDSDDAAEPYYIAYSTYSTPRNNYSEASIPRRPPIDFLHAQHFRDLVAAREWLVKTPLLWDFVVHYWRECWESETTWKIVWSISDFVIGCPLVLLWVELTVGRDE